MDCDLWVGRCHLHCVSLWFWCWCTQWYANILYCSHNNRSFLKIKRIYTKIYIFILINSSPNLDIFVHFSAHGHKSIVIFCMTLMTIINLYYNDKENRPCLYLPNYACPDSISCAAHGSTAKGGWEFYCPVGKRGK